MAHSEKAKRKAVELRQSGMTVSEVAKELGVAKGTVSYWLRGTVLCDRARQLLEEKKIERKKEAVEKRGHGLTPQTKPTQKGYNSKRVGEKSEGQVLARFLLFDMVVLQPFGDNQRYDFVVDEGKGKFVRVQCKTARLTRIGFEFSTDSTIRTGVKQGYKGEADVFVVYVRENDSVYVFKVDDCPRSSCKVQMTCKRKGGRLAGDHLLVEGKPLLDYS